MSTRSKPSATIPLGTAAEYQYRAPQIPYGEAASEIAARTGTTVVDRGTVRMDGFWTSLLRGPSPWDTAPMSEQEVDEGAERTRTALALVVIISVVLAILIALGNLL